MPTSHVAEQHNSPSKSPLDLFFDASGSLRDAAVVVRLSDGADRHFISHFPQQQAPSKGVCNTGEEWTPSVVDDDAGIECPACGSTNTSTDIQQTQAADEAGIKKVVCRDCGSVSRRTD